MTEERRIAKLLFSGQMLIEFLKTGERPGKMIVERGLPADAEIVGANYDAIMDRWEIGVRSETFDVVPIECEPPTLSAIVIHQVYDEATV